MIHINDDALDNGLRVLVELGDGRRLELGITAHPERSPEGSVHIHLEGETFARLSVMPSGAPPHGWRASRAVAAPSYA